MMAALFSTPKVATPVVKPPATMPDTDDPAVLAAKRRATAEAAGRGGRASTILTSPDDTLGAGSSMSGSSDYSSKTLGGQ
jgi:hypothetical protein